MHDGQRIFLRIRFGVGIWEGCTLHITTALGKRVRIDDFDDK
jgi:hypothetical protein